MASENVELVRSLCSAWERGDWSSAAWAHPEIEFEVPGDIGPRRRQVDWSSRHRQGDARSSRHLGTHAARYGGISRARQ
jgi:hypothetical protein